MNNWAVLQRVRRGRYCAERGCAELLIEGREKRGLCVRFRLFLRIKKPVNIVSVTGKVAILSGKLIYIHENMPT